MIDWHQLLIKNIKKCLNYSKNVHIWAFLNNFDYKHGRIWNSADSIYSNQIKKISASNIFESIMIDFVIRIYSIFEYIRSIRIYSKRIWRLFDLFESNRIRPSIRIYSNMLIRIALFDLFDLFEYIRPFYSILSNKYSIKSIKLNRSNDLFDFIEYIFKKFEIFEVFECIDLYEYIRIFSIRIWSIRSIRIESNRISI